MRLLCPLSCLLSLFFFIRYWTIAPQRSNPNESLLLSIVITGFVGWMFYELYRVIRRWRPNPVLWRIIYILMGVLVVLIIIAVPEIQAMILGWLSDASDPAEKMLVLSFICLVICVVCRTRPTRSSSSTQSNQV